MSSGNALHLTSHQAWTHRALNLAFCAGGIIVCYGAFSLFQEEITQKSYGKNGNEKFVYMQALVFFQCASNLLLAWFARRRSASNISSTTLAPKTDVDNVPAYLYSMCSISYFLAMLFSNLALEWVNYPTQVLGKSCKPIPIMLFGVLFAHKRYALRKYFYVLMIVVGMAIFLYKPEKGGKGSFEFGKGELLLCASLTMDGVTGAVQDWIRHYYKTDKWMMMFSMNAFSTFFLSLMLIASGELIAFFSFITTYPEALRQIVLFAISGAIGQCFIFKTVADFGPLTCSIVTTLRKLFTLVFSIVIFSHPYTDRHVLGIVLVFVALMMDAIDSRKNHSAAKAKSYGDTNGYLPVPRSSDEKQT